MFFISRSPAAIKSLEMASALSEEGGERNGSEVRRTKNLANLFPERSQTLCPSTDFAPFCEKKISGF